MRISKKVKRPYVPGLLRLGLGLFLTISSFAILYTTAQNYRSAKIQATQALQSTAFALSATAESALRSMDNTGSEKIRKIFADRVVAYALIIDKKGKILFHTNPYLVGSFLAEPTASMWPRGNASGRRVELRTGAPAYEFSYIVHPPDGTAELLRLVLYTTPADAIVDGARRMWWTVGGTLFILWTVGILLDRVFVRHFELHQELEQRRQLAVIGQMTAVVAHEVRNALGSVKGYAQWVDEKTEPADPKKKALAIVLQGVARIESMVNDLLLFSREETYRLEDIDPIQVIRDVIHTTVPHPDQRVLLDATPGISVVGDREKLHRVLFNGIRNAVQAMGENGRVQISVRPDGVRVTVRIEDSGSGIAAEELPHLFTPFHTTKVDGVGLGLAYSKKVVEGMGGKISLANRPEGSGAVLTIELPKTGEG